MNLGAESIDFLISHGGEKKTPSRSPIRFIRFEENTSIWLFATRIYQEVYIIHSKTSRGMSW